jgi:hypothetical protein
VDGAGSPISDRRVHVEVIVWEDDIVKNVLPIPRLADFSTKMRRIMNFEPVDGHLMFLIPAGHEFVMHSSPVFGEPAPNSN